MLASANVFAFAKSRAARVRARSRADTSVAASDLLPAEAVAAFRAHGFCTLHALTDADEVALIRTELHALLSRRAGLNEGALTDLIAPGGDPELSPVMTNPSNFAPFLRRTRHRANAFAIARAILGPDAKLAFEQMIYKPPGKGAATPWHQDDAFTADADAECAQISIWMPLQDVTAESGCMRYIAGSHLGPLYEHGAPGGDVRVNGLECAIPPDAPAPRDVPLPAGGCVIHHSRTMHGSNPNMSGVERMAYVLAFDGPPKRRAGPVMFPWHVSKQTKRVERYKRWLWRGGWAIQAWRKIRDGRFNDPRRLGYKFGRAVRKMLLAARRRGRSAG